MSNHYFPSAVFIDVSTCIIEQTARHILPKWFFHLANLASEPINQSTNRYPHVCYRSLKQGTFTPNHSNWNIRDQYNRLNWQSCYCQNTKCCHMVASSSYTHIVLLVALRHRPTYIYLASHLTQLTYMAKCKQRHRSKSQISEHLKTACSFFLIFSLN